ncbi:transposase [Blautia wexlerae]|nr:transposase [Blautia wexlerae]
MPSYLRRSAIQHALGTVSSYKTRLDLWEKTDGKSGKPKLVYENHAMPVFYRDVMYREGAEGKDEAYLKLYDGHDWKWSCVRLDHTDMEYLRKCWSGKKASAPTLEKRHQKYFLRFSYKEEVTLTKTPVKEQIICSVDLGINTDAVCTGKPKLVYENHAMPVFYRDVMYREGAEGKDEAYLKLYDGHDWKWFCVRLEHTDMEYLRKCWSGKKASAPTLEKRHRKYFLRFSYKEEVTLTKTPVKEQIICSVDLGINTDAVCTIMRADGTVLGRKFIDHPSEKDRMYRTLRRIRRSQREHGSAQTQGRWAYTKRLNTELGKKIAGAIVRYAEENHADVIVFEYLEMQGKISGKKKQKLHLWRKRDIQRRCGHQAHRKGMRVSRICAWNTSRLAYDGSGAVIRDWENHSLCTFQTGKRYNCDLSASYNIGARYFVRELLKPLPATERSLLEAKVPPVKRRTSCVYADLRKLHSEMELLKAA